ncbi:MAG: hypothetical protein JNK79_10205 [Chitinophagaceae bacterium]|nr:hypothetical protein [Chitinophagaceae bacterium]
MKSNRNHIKPNSSDRSNLFHALNREKETLVTMFLSSATHNELTEQIKKIDALCSRIDKKQHNKLPD